MDMGILELVETLKAHTGRAWNVAWNPKGNILASCGEDKIIYLWSKDCLGKWQQKHKLESSHSKTIREVSWSPCGNYLASASFDSTIGIWDKKSGDWECDALLEGHEHEVKSVTWANNGKMLASCSRDKSVWIWEVTDDQEYECSMVIDAHRKDVKKVRFHPQSEILASASYDNTIKLFKEDKFEDDWLCYCTLSSHESTVWSLCFDKTGSRFASVSDDKTLKIWKQFNSDGENIVILGSGTEHVWKNICTLSGFHDRTIYDVSWCPNTDLIATACGDDSIRIFQESQPTAEKGCNFDLIYNMQKAHNQDVNGVAWNPVIPGLLASCGDDGLVKLWQFQQ